MVGNPLGLRWNRWGVILPLELMSTPPTRREK